MASDIWNVQDYGATADGKTLDSPAIDAAINDCASAGGGVVFIPAGTYSCGTIHLKDNITLQISPGATVLFHPDDDKFDEGEVLPFNPNADSETSLFHFALIRAENVSNIAIVGGGSIVNEKYPRGGPKPISIKGCQQVTIRDITIRNGPNYTISLMDSDYISIENVNIFAGQADGIDFDNCRFGRVANSLIEAYDDAICLKASPALGHISSTENIAVTNCSIQTACSALKLGTESSGDFKNIAFSNCTVYPKPFARSALSGIAIESVDGAHISGLVASNITMIGPCCAIFLRLGNRGRAQKTPTPGMLENVSISNIVATGVTRPCLIAGIPGHFVKHVTLDNVMVEVLPFKNFKGSGETSGEKLGAAVGLSARDADKLAFKMADLGTPAAILSIPEREDKYPESTMFGILPVWGFYCRHAADVTLKNIQLRVTGDDPRAAVVFDDVHSVIVDGLKANGKRVEIDPEEVKPGKIIVKNSP